MTREPTAWQIAQAMSEWQQMRHRLVSADPTLEDDEVRLADLMQREDASVTEIAAALCRVSIAAHDMVGMIKRRIEELEARATKFADRRDRTKDAALRIVEALGSPTLREADFTASRGRSKGKTVIVDEKLIPDRFFKTERTVMTREVGEAIEGGEQVPGAVKTNGTVYLRIVTR